MTNDKEPGDVAESERENHRLRMLLCEVLKALGNGSGASPECSLVFLASIPEEVRLVMADLRAAAPVPEAGQGLSDEQLEAKIEAALPLLDAASRKALTFTRWHDGIDCDYVTTTAKAFARALLSPAPAQAQAPVEVSGEALAQIVEQLQIMLGSAKQHSDGDAVTGYTIKTGALHRILGILCGAGYPVTVPLMPAASPVARVEVTAAGWAQLFVHGVHLGSGYGQEEKDRLDAKAAELNAACAASPPPQSAQLIEPNTSQDQQEKAK